MVKFISSRELRNAPAAVWEALRANEAVALLSNGEPRALMFEIEEGDIATALEVLRRVRAQIALSRLRAGAAARGADQLTEDEVDAEVRAARAVRKK
jgi:hypothetical protein